MKWFFILLIFISACTPQEIEISDFETCAAAGNPVIETYPPQCEHEGINYIYELNDYWRLDDIQLMQHSSEGYYGCFGCDSGLFVDPVDGMVAVSESDELHCNSDFEVEGSGAPFNLL